MRGRFFSFNAENAIKIVDAGGLKVTQAVPKKCIIHFFGFSCLRYHDAIFHIVESETYNL